MTTKITLYTAHHCPWAHRCQIALRELNLEFETVLVDILVPRTSEYLAINPNGMVPALKYENQILTESNFIAQFLVDSHPSHLLKSSAEIGGPKQRYEIGLFVSTFFSAVQSIFDRAVFSLAGQVKTGLVDDFINAVVEKIEPHLADTAAPYYGGSRHLTFAEVLIGPFLLRIFNLPKYDDILPKSLLQSLEEKAPRFWRWGHAVIAEKSVNSIWDEDRVVKLTIARITKMRAAATTNGSDQRAF